MSADEDRSQILADFQVWHALIDSLIMLLVSLLVLLLFLSLLGTWYMDREEVLLLPWTGKVHLISEMNSCMIHYVYPFSIHIWYVL